MFEVRNTLNILLSECYTKHAAADYQKVYISRIRVSCTLI